MTCQHVYGVIEDLSLVLDTEAARDEAEHGEYVSNNVYLYRFCPYCGEEIHKCTHVYGLYHDDEYIEEITDPDVMGNLLTEPGAAENVEVFYYCPVCGKQLVRNNE